MDFDFKALWRKQRATKEEKPISVNYHFHRVCNYSCGFCFHTNTNPDKLSLEQAKLGLQKLKEAGMRKINFSGGEPFLHAKMLGDMVVYCKRDLGVESVSIVSNGSLIKEDWFQDYAEYLDILAISCDSFDDDTNERIGRAARGSTARPQRLILQGIQRLCEQYDVKFKINSVICAFNWKEDMREHILELKPCRWKVFQVLPLEGENIGATAKRNVTEFLITSEHFASFVERHCGPGINIVPESNETMQNSYLILDEKMRFLNCTGGSKRPSRSILDVPVEAALAEAGFDAEMFRRRDGEYDWTKHAAPAAAGVGARSHPPGLGPVHGGTSPSRADISGCEAVDF